MADDGILGLLGRMNDPAALYGGALTDPATQQAMAGRGLLAMAGSFADSAMPTRMPTPIGAVLGHAAAALGTSQDAVMEARLRNAQAQQAMANTGLLNQLGPAYQQYFEAARKEQERLDAAAAAGGGIASPPVPGAAIPGATGTGPAPTGPIDPALVTWHAKNLGLDPLIAHTALDIESSYGKNLGNEKSPSNTGAYQRARADAPGGQNDTIPNQISLGIGDLVAERSRLSKLLGREPTNAEVYLAHQQGPDGAYKLISNLDTPAGNLVRPINISNNAGDPKASAGAFVKHWEQEYNKREARFAGMSNVAAAGPAGGGIAAGPPPPPGAVRGLLDMPDLTGQMNAPIPGIADVAPAAPGSAAAARPPTAGDILVAANQATQAAGGLPRLSPGLPQMADASGQVPPGPILVPGGRAIPSLLQQPGAAPPPPAAPPQVAAGPPQSLVTSPQPQPPVPPPAQPQAPPPAPAAPMGGPPAPPPLNLPAPPPMPGGMGPAQPTPLQMIAQGIVGLSSLTGHPAPDFMQKIAGQPVEMQMEAYKAYVGAQANQMTEKYKKEIEVASAGTISYLTRMGALPGDIALRTAEQDLNLRNTMLTQHGLVRTPDGKSWQFDPVWLNAQAQKAGATAAATEAAKNAATYGPTYPMGGGPPTIPTPGTTPSAPPLPGAPAPTANEPAKGTPSPYGMLPPLSEQNLPRSKVEADAAVPLWNNRVDAWTAAIGPAQVAEQRMLTIADAFKSIQSGKWAEQRADIVTKLEAIGIRLDPSIIDNAAKVQVVLHENVLSTLPMLKAATRNPTQTEFTTTREVREGPNVEPAANLQMLAEDIAMMRQVQNLPAAFHASGWQNSLQFESAYLGRNKLAPMVTDIKKEIGQLGGMPGWVPPGLPPGSKDTGKFHEGKPVYEHIGPDGQPVRGTLQ